MIKSFEQIIEFNELANGIKDKRSKLAYACKKVQKRVAEYIEDYIDKLKDLEVEYASIDSNGDLIVKENKYSYKPERLKALNEAKKKLWKSYKSKEYEFESYICTEITEELTDEEKDILEGFVL